MFVAKAGANDLVEKGLAAGFDPNEWSEGMNETSALYEAIRSGHESTVALLISRGAGMPAKPHQVGFIFSAAKDKPAYLRMLLDVFIAQNRDETMTRYVRNTLRGSKNPETKALRKEYGIQ